MWDFFIALVIVMIALVGLQFWAVCHACSKLTDEQRQKLLDWSATHPDCGWPDDE